jgi:hypothetical protein
MAQPPTGTRLPPTGSTITMSEVRNFFGSTTTPITMSFLGTFVGISVGNTVQLSATFGDLLVDDYPV